MVVFETQIDAQIWLIDNDQNDWNFELVQNRNGETFYMFTPIESENPDVFGDEIISIEEIDTVYENYVYDIETEDGTFQAGLGSMIVKNTDSIYTKFVVPGQDDMSEDEKINKIYDISVECAKRISATFKKPIELEMEDLKYPIALYAKKCYVYRCIERNWKRDIKDNGIVFKGLQMVRRDSCPYVKKIANPIIHELMYNRDIDKAMKLARESVRNLLDDKVDIDCLVISKSLKAKYKETNKAGNNLKPPAHWFLAQKIKERSPGNEPKPGSRVPYVFIQNKDKTAQQSDRVEDPIYTTENKIKIDSLYYLDKQIASPLEKLFSVIIKNKDNELFPLDKHNKLTKLYKKECAKLMWEDLRKTYENKMNGQRQLNHFFKKVPKIEEMEEIDSDDEII